MNDSGRKVKVVYLRETTVSSIVQDLFSFGIMCASFWFNYTFINGNNFLDIILFVSFFTFSIARAGQIKRYLEIAKAEPDKED